MSLIFISEQRKGEQSGPNQKSAALNALGWRGKEDGPDHALWSRGGIKNRGRTKGRGRDGKCRSAKVLPGTGEKKKEGGRRRRPVASS